MAESVEVVKGVLDATNRADFAVRDGKVAAVKMYQSKDEALEAASAEG